MTLRTLRLPSALAAASLFSGAAPAFAQSTGPSSSQSPYLLPVSPAQGATQSILTAGDTIGGYKMVGIPDGLGAYDNGNGTFTVLMNHELGAAAGVTRAHGSAGAFVSEWVINKDTLQVLSGGDLIQSVNLWNGSAFVSGTTAFNRFCSADLPAGTAFFNSSSGLGTTARIFMNGEEAGTSGRAFGHIASGASKGVSYELPALGKFSWENSVANPVEQDKTIVMGQDDTSGGQVYMYVGIKKNTGTDIDKAGLTGGTLYGVKVTGLSSETAGTSLAAGTQFTLASLGDVSNKTGATLQSDSVTAGVTGFLRPEDGAWDPAHPTDYYFVTTDAFNAPSRLWRLRYSDISQPELGGTIDELLDGTEGQQMFDNIGFASNGSLLLQEDPGNNAHLAKVWNYDPATDSLKMLFQHDSSRFVSGGGSFLTQDEESSGVVDVSGILGPDKVLLVVQSHLGVGGELVEGGQLLLATVPEAQAWHAIAGLGVVAALGCWWRQRCPESRGASVALEARL